jgi:hypothetical protein
MTKRCFNCKHWDAPKDKNGRRINGRGRGFRCLYPEIQWPDMPECQALETYRIKMSASDGVNCDVWERAQ